MRRAKNLSDWLSAAYQDSGHCPPSESLLAAEREGLDPESLAKMEQHIGNCPACAAEQDLARMYDQIDPSTAQDEDVEWIVGELSGPTSKDRVVAIDERRTSRRSRIVVPLAIAATALIAMGLLIQSYRMTPPSLPEVPDATEIRSTAIELVEPQGELEIVPARFVWVGVAAASTYQVILTKGDGKEVWRAEFESSPGEVPAEVRSTFQPAVVYYWRVEATDAEGRVVGRSAANRIQVQLSEDH